MIAIDNINNTYNRLIYTLGESYILSGDPHIDVQPWVDAD